MAFIVSKYFSYSPSILKFPCINEAVPLTFLAARWTDTSLYVVDIEQFGEGCFPNSASVIFHFQYQCSTELCLEGHQIFHIDM